MDSGISTFVTVIITLIVMAIFGGGLYMLMRFTFPLFLLDEDKDLPSLNNLYEITDRFAKAQQDINDRMRRIVTNQQKLIDELKVRLDKLKEK